MGTISKALRFEVLARDGFRCRYCGATAQTAELQVDHVLARKHGGRDEAANLVTACQPCNSGKSDRKLLDLPAGFALSPDNGPGRLAKAQRSRSAASAAPDRHWIDSGILDVADRADGDVLVLVHCATHGCREWHWIDERTVKPIETWGPEPGWIRGAPWS